MNMKGSNRKMFRKPGAARRAVGILASSPELAGEVTRRGDDQPVQRFNLGGLAEMIGYNPGYTEEGQAVPGFGGFYQRLSGISDPARAREQSGLDLMRLGARIAGGQSTRTAENVASALTETLGEVQKRRQTEFTNELAMAQLEDAREKQEQAKQLAALKRRTDVVQPLADELAVVGASIDPESGFIRYGGELYSGIDTAIAAMSDKDKATFQQGLQKSARLTEGQEARRLQYDPDPTTFGRAMSAVISELGGAPDSSSERKAVAAEARKAAAARGFRVIEGKSATDVMFFDDATQTLYDIYGVPATRTE